jgi:hypothetical protein
MYQNDPIDLTRESLKTWREYKPSPWRRTYGPAFQAGHWTSLFFGSVAIVALLTLLSILGVREFIDLGALFTFNYNLDLPIIIGTL